MEDVTLMLRHLKGNNATIIDKIKGSKKKVDKMYEDKADQVF